VLLLQIFRFYYRCKNCAAEFCMKTDPKTSDYVMEEGASRNYEPWREVCFQQQQQQQQWIVTSSEAAAVRGLFCQAAVNMSKEAQQLHVVRLVACSRTRPITLTRLKQAACTPPMCSSDQQSC
jgi:hypothetical protein